MDKIWSVDWSAMFVPSMALAEVLLRGSFMYLALFTVLRFLGNRQSGNLSPADLLVVVLIADAAQNALGAHYESLTEGVALVLTIVGWDYVLDWLQYRVPALRPWLEPRPLALVVDGRVNQRNLRAEMITLDQLESQLREKGVEDVGAVKRACLESNGQLSVILKSQTS